ncbi:unnamed protein product [marine sediment metagenome]|uniref:Uncharacterized protein n=1 Tax=marine sediment metagenome TaxID=412755 RepID=X1G936_9ZZZZ
MDAASGAQAEDRLCFLVVFPDVRAQIGHLDKTFDAKLARLDKYAETGEAGDDAVEFIADVLAQHYKNQNGGQFPFGVLSTLFGEGDVFSDLGQVLFLVLWDCFILQMAFQDAMDE